MKGKKGGERGREAGNEPQRKGGDDVVAGGSHIKIIMGDTLLHQVPHKNIIAAAAV